MREETGVTPLPWKVVHQLSGDVDIVSPQETGGILVCNCGGGLSETSTPLSNAAFIINAVNNYQRMLQLLKDAQEELRLIHMKDVATVYDPTLRSRIESLLTAVEEQK